jgi:hypothetical protein
MLPKRHTSERKENKMVKGKGMPLKDDPIKEDDVLDALKELTKCVAENTVILKSMKASHDKWVRAGKF